MLLCYYPTIAAGGAVSMCTVILMTCWHKHSQFIRCMLCVLFCSTHCCHAGQQQCAKSTKQQQHIPFGTKHLQFEQRKFLQQHKLRADSYSKAAATMKKQRKKKNNAQNADKEIKVNKNALVFNIDSFIKWKPEWDRNSDKNNNNGSTWGGRLTTTTSKSIPATAHLRVFCYFA